MFLCSLARLTISVYGADAPKPGRFPTSKCLLLVEKRDKVIYLRHGLIL